MPDLRREKKNRSLGIYVHIPFCVRKCEYCDFLSMPADAKTRDAYCEALLQEIEKAGQHYRQEAYEVDTIFFGGGTPSILDPKWLEAILRAIGENFRVKGWKCHGTTVERTGETEVTIECNPGTLSEEKLRIYTRAGINRISMGLQSADNRQLALLGRIHTWEDFLESARLVKKHFQNWNVDLMSALPGQSVESYEQTIRQVLELEPTHISAYSLIIEEGTPFYEKYEEDELLRQRGEKPQVLPDEETERVMYEMTARILKECGYDRYEISNYAKAGCASRHNERYWKRQDYLGLGLGASSCMDNVRFKNCSDMEEYLAGNFEKEDVEWLTREEQMEEMMFLGLRRMEGVDAEEFRKEFGIGITDVFGEVLTQLEKEHLLSCDGGKIRLTQKGIDVSNYVLSQFLLDS